MFLFVEQAVNNLDVSGMQNLTSVKPNTMHSSKYKIANINFTLIK